MATRRFHHTSVFLTQYAALTDPELDSFPDFCLYDHPALEALKGRAEPICRVFLTRLEPRVRVYADAGLKTTIECSDDVSECVLSQALLYDTRPLGQIMCIGLGRFPHNLLRPFIGDDVEAYYHHPELYDPGSVCAQVSRDHALLFLDEQGQLLFRDFGTKKAGQRGGSKNGSWINGAEPIQDSVITWLADDFLGVGGRVTLRDEQGEERKEHYFKLRYERIEQGAEWIKPVRN
jgi:hypothetical protein